MLIKGGETQCVNKYWAWGLMDVMTLSVEGIVRLFIKIVFELYIWEVDKNSDLGKVQSVYGKIPNIVLSIEHFKVCL